MKRVLTAFFLVPVGIYLALFAPAPVFAGVIAVFSCLLFYEYARMIDAGRVRCLPNWSIPIAMAAGVAVLLTPSAFTFPLLMAVTMAAMCLPLAAPDLDRSVLRAGMLVLGILYVFGSMRAAILLRGIEDPPLHHLTAGRHWLMFGLMINWIGDTGAYYVGRKFGRHKLAPVASPKKSWEGAAASVLAAVIFGVVYLPLAIPGIGYWTAAAAAFIGNAAGQLGDLAESAIKRAWGVKDSGTMLPGHGGILDRLDSTLFTLPVLWMLISYLKPGT